MFHDSLTHVVDMAFCPAGRGRVIVHIDTYQTLHLELMIMELSLRVSVSQFTDCANILNSPLGPDGKVSCPTSRVYVPEYKCSSS